MTGTAFGPQAPNASTSLPLASVNVYGDSVDTWVQDTYVAGRNTGTVLNAQFFNMIIGNLRQAVRDAGISLVDGDMTLLSKAIIAQATSVSESIMASTPFNWGQIRNPPTSLAGYGIKDATPISHVGTGGAAHALATQMLAGFLSPTDKAKIDSLATVAVTGSYRNLSDTPVLAAVATSGSASDITRGTLPVSQLPVGTSAGTVAAGNDSRIVGAVQASTLGAANGVATLDGSGKVPSAQLPSYVDDVLEYSTYSALPAPGEAGKIYVTTDTNYEYRWSGSTYIRLVASPGSTDAVAEGTVNLYFTAARALAAVPASNATPTMAGTPSAGSAVSWARGDHVHPSDTSRLAIASLGSNVLAALNTALNAAGGLLGVNQAASTYATRVAASLSGGVTVSGGLAITAGTPSNTAGVLYSDASNNLYWNGFAIGNGAAANGTPNTYGLFTGTTSLGNGILSQVTSSMVQAYAGGVATTLQIGGNANGKTALQISTSADAGGFATLQAIQSQGGAWGNIVLNAQGGNVGVGALSPSARIHTVTTDGNNVALFSGDTNLIRVTPTATDIRLGGLNVAQSAYSTLRIDGAPLFLNTITGGNVVVGSGNTYAKFHVNGTDGNNAAVFSGGTNLLRITPTATDITIGSLDAGLSYYRPLTICGTSVDIEANFAIRGIQAAANWVTGFVTPELFGAAGDGSADDTPYVQAAFNDGRPVYLPNKYKITAGIARTGNLYVFGRGRNSGLIAAFTTGNAIGVWLPTAANPIGSGGQLVLRDFAIMPAAAGANMTALNVNGTASDAGSSEPEFFIQNVHVLPTSTSNYSGNGFLMSDLRNGVIDGCTIFGRYGNNGAGGAGIAFLASSPNSAPVRINIRNSEVSWWTYGITFNPYSASSGTNDIEGVHILSNTILACQYCIYGSSNDKSSAFINIQGNDLEFGIMGIRLSDWMQVRILNNYALADTSAGTGVAQYGIYNVMNSSVSQYGWIAFNTVDFSNTAGSISSRTGIVCNNSGGAIRTTVVPNKTILASTGYSLSASTETSMANQAY